MTRKYIVWISKKDDSQHVHYARSFAEYEKLKKECRALGFEVSEKHEYSDSLESLKHYMAIFEEIGSTIIQIRPECHGLEVPYKFKSLSNDL